MFSETKPSLVRHSQNHAEDTARSSPPYAQGLSDATNDSQAYRLVKEKGPKQKHEPIIV